MGLTPLTTAQHELVNALVARSRLKSVPVDMVRAQSFMTSAQERLADAPHVTRPQNRYSLSYDACHDVGEALLAGHGYRTTSGPGQHEALGQFLRTVLDVPPGDAAAKRFELLRQARNRNHYAAQPVTTADAAVALETAQELLSAAMQKGLIG